MKGGLLLGEDFVEGCDFKWIKLADFICFYDILLIGAGNRLFVGVVPREEEEQPRKVIIGGRV